MFNVATLEDVKVGRLMWGASFFLNFLVVTIFVLIYEIITQLNTIIYKHIFNIIYFARSL